MYRNSVIYVAFVLESSVCGKSVTSTETWNSVVMARHVPANNEANVTWPCCTQGHTVTGLEGLCKRFFHDNRQAFHRKKYLSGVVYVYHSAISVPMALLRYLIILKTDSDTKVEG